jgi:hypothetical protein
VQKNIVTLFSLRSSDEFSHPGDQQIEGRHSLLVVIVPHVKGLGGEVQVRGRRVGGMVGGRETLMSLG